MCFKNILPVKSADIIYDPENADITKPMYDPGIFFSRRNSGKKGRRSKKQQLKQNWR